MAGFSLSLTLAVTSCLSDTSILPLQLIASYIDPNK